MAQTLAIFNGVPAWDWLLLAYLIYRGFSALKGGATGLGKLAALPIVFTIWVLAQLWNDGQAGALTALTWILTAAAGIALSMFVNSDQDIAIDRDNRAITLPGSPMTLILVLVTFVSKYWIGFTLTTRGTATLLGIDNVYILVDAAISGAVTGIFAGRFFNCWRRYAANDSGTNT